MEPHAALAEAGADYTLVLVERDELGRSPPAYFALNPWGLVPTLEDRDLVLTESAAIIGGAGSTPVLSLRRREDGRSYAGKEGVTRAHASIHARPWKGRLSAARSAKPLQMAENDRESLSPIPNTSLTENRSEMYPFRTRKAARDVAWKDKHPCKCGLKPTPGLEPGTPSLRVPSRS